ncbi:MAG: TetR/AcrR family transcriptional regulator [Clostridia bacterium]|nr:TetR/AcrR family transcriptional regulator [Clostridia bacterium]
MPGTERKTDRRTLYTRRVIKDALLELLSETTYEKINVTLLCRQAEITRATFYLHYADLNEVLDEVIGEALEIAEHETSELAPEVRNRKLMEILENGPQALRGNEKYLAPCQRIADHPKYRSLFMDDSLSYYIIRKIYLSEKDSSVPMMQKEHNLDAGDADRLFMFVIYGLYYVNRSMRWEKNDDWYRMQYLVTNLFFSGLESVKALPEKFRKP